MKRLLLLLALLVGAAAVGLPASAQVKDAEKAFKKQQYDEALAHLDEALQKKPDDAKALELQGRVYQEKAFATEDPDAYAALLGRMHESYERALAVKPDLAKDVRNNLVLAYLGEFQRGVEVFNQGQTDDDEAAFLRSARHFRGCTVIAPDSSGPYVNWAFSLMKIGRNAEAIEPLEGAVAHGGADEDVYTFLGSLYLTNDRAADAVPLLEEAVKAFPANEGLQNQLLNAYGQTGQLERALEVYAQTVAADPTNKVYRYNYGSMLLEAEQFDAAIEQLREAVRLDDAYTDAQYNLGAAFVNKAVFINDRMTEIDDDLRANRSTLSQEEIQAREAEIDKMADERRALFGQAVAPLEKAKSLGEADGRDVQPICRVLFQSYVQTNQTEKAEAMQACAFGN